MTTTVKAESAAHVAEIVRAAIGQKHSLYPCGARTKFSAPNESPNSVILDITALNQLAYYDPADLTLSVDAGMPLAQLNAILGEQNQFIPLLVPFYSTSTIGGTIASGIDSPLRQFFGTARDFLIGAEFVDGAGKLCKSGGRVVKNVTGYDLHKLLIGSLGTLAILTRLNFRTFPAPIAGSRGFVASFATPEAALAVRRKIANSPLTPLTLDVINPSLAQIFATHTLSTPELPVLAGENKNAPAAPLPLPGNWFRPYEWQLCAAFAGPPEILTRYTRDLTQFAEDTHATAATFLDDSNRPSLWGRLREACALLRDSSPASQVFKINALPADHLKILQSLHPHPLIARASGPIYFSVPTTDAPPSLPIAELHPLFSLADNPLTRRLKSAFDPHNILASSRF
jgi:glycolate oxidase FAD binding subunit